MLNMERAHVTAQAINRIIHKRMQAELKRAVAEVWSEVASHDTYGPSDRQFVSFIREAERQGEEVAELWFANILAMIKQEQFAELNVPCH